MQHSDVVSVHASYGPDTINLIGPKQIALMKKQSVLVNTARAELVEPNALRQSLVDRRIWAAAFDAYYKEPVPSPKADEYGLVSLSKEVMLITPHTAFKTRDAVELMTQMDINSILSVFDDAPNEHVINPEYKRHRHH